MCKADVSDAHVRRPGPDCARLAETHAHLRLSVEPKRVVVKGGSNAW